MIGMIGLIVLAGLLTQPLQWLGLSGAVSFLIAVPLTGFFVGMLNIGIRQPQLFRVWLLGAILSRGGGDR